MNDTIYRQAAIDAIADYLRRVCLAFSDYMTDDESKECATCILQLVPSAQPEQRWIPCSERLPEYDGEMYLVTDYCEQINRRRIHISYCYVNREGFWSDVPIGYKVIAWMPLPEPYRKDGD